MTAEVTLYRLLANDSTIAALVDERIYQDLAVQGAALPYIVYGRTGTEPVTTIHGAVAASFVTLQIQCWARTRAASEDVQQAVVSELNAAGEAYVARSAVYDEEADAFGGLIDVTIFET